MTASSVAQVATGASVSGSAGVVPGKRKIWGMGALAAVVSVGILAL